MKKFEYKIEGRSRNNPLSTQELNKFGDSGWELVNVDRIARPGEPEICTHYIYHFKREVIPSPTKEPIKFT